MQFIIETCIELNVIDKKEFVLREVRQTNSKALLITSLCRLPSAKVEIFDEIKNRIQNIDYENKEICLLDHLNCDLRDVKPHHMHKPIS